MRLRRCETTGAIHPAVGFFHTVPWLNLPSQRVCQKPHIGNGYCFWITTDAIHAAQATVPSKYSSTFSMRCAAGSRAHPPISFPIIRDGTPPPMGAQVWGSFARNVHASGTAMILHWKSVRTEASLVPGLFPGRYSKAQEECNLRHGGDAIRVATHRNGKTGCKSEPVHGGRK